VRSGLLAGLLLLATLVHAQEPPSFAPAPPPPEPGLRIATFNTSLYSEESGGLVARLRAGDGDARRIAAVIQHLRPDIVLLNEFDFDGNGLAADLFQKDYLEQAQFGQAAIRYPYRYLAPVNTGVPSGLDLNNDGRIGGEGRERGDDAWGYGLHPGQYGMLVLSMFPIDVASARTFQNLRWSAMPNARRPRHPGSGDWWYDDAEWKQLRLSSKSHWDLPIETPRGRLHLLAAHPTPPIFDGPEDRNGQRNADELRLWQEYLTPGAHDWLCDDGGRCGGLEADARFVIVGDLNNDPVDGEAVHEAITALIGHPRVARVPAPRSDGALQPETDQPVDARHRGDPATDTSRFGPYTGKMRLDFVLPSVGLTVAGSGVFWPKRGETGFEWLDATDHRMVWIDLE
jgi:hypothetical protein